METARGPDLFINHEAHGEGYTGTNYQYIGTFSHDLMANLNTRPVLGVDYHGRDRNNYMQGPV